MFKITSIKTKKLESENSKILGLARVVIDDCFVIEDIKIIQGSSEKGMFVAFPSRKQQNGEFKDVCHPLTAETRKYFEDIILAEFKLGGSNDASDN